MRKVLYGLMTGIMGVMMLSAPLMVVNNSVYAAECDCPDGSKGVKTAILSGGCSCDDGQGGEVIRILNLVVSILTIGIGILGVVGITVVGIQYLTAGGSEEKTRKAKRRLFEIVIGLVAYVLIYALLSFLIPDFHPF